jgi:hypothetical protein
MRMLGELFPRLTGMAAQCSVASQFEFMATTYEGGHNIVCNAIIAVATALSPAATAFRRD